VAVSATGFSPAVRNLARSKQVDLQSLEELEADVVFDWLYAQTVEYRMRHVDAAGVSIDIAEQVTKIDSARLASKPGEN